jgi:hypothetical protein
MLVRLRGKLGLENRGSQLVIFRPPGIKVADFSRQRTDAKLAFGKIAIFPYNKKY